MRNSPGLILMLLAGLLLPVSFADVYSVRGGSSFAGRLGWKVAYSTEMNLNGNPAKVQVWASSDSFARTVGKLQDAWRARGFPEAFVAGEVMGYGMVLEGRMVIRYLIVDPGGDDHVMITQTAQTIEAFHRGNKRGAAEALKQIPAYPGSKEISFMRDEQTRLATAVSESSDHPWPILSWYDRKMETAGWIIPLTSGAGARVYVKDGAKAIVSVRMVDRQTRIVRTYKKEAK